MKIKEDVLNILTGKYKNYHRAWLFALFLVVYFFSPVPALAFSDNFNDNDITDWNMVPALSTQNTYSINGALDYYMDFSMHTTGGKYAEIAGGALATEWQFDFNTTASGAGAIVGFDFMYNTTSPPSYNCPSALGGEVGICVKNGALYAQGFSYTGSSSIVNNYWYRVNILRVGNNMRMRVYNATNGILLTGYDSTGGLTNFITGFNKLRVYSYAGIGSPEVRYKVDNIVTYTVPPSPSNSISWGSTSYVPADTGSFSWVITDADWTDTIIGVPYGFRAELFKNDDTLATEAWDIGAQTGTGYYTFPEMGTYNIKLNKYFLVPIGGTFLDTDVLVVRSAGTAYITGMSYAATFTDTNYTYSFGVGGIARPAIVVSYTDPVTGNPVSESSVIISGSGTALLPAGMTPVSFRREALYTLRLKDLSTGKYYASPFTVQTYFETTPPTQNISSSSIALDRASYYYGQQMIVNWKVDNSNFTSPNQTYLDVFNIDSQLITGETWADDGYWRCASGSVCGIGEGQSSSNYWILIQNSMFDVAQRYWQSGNNQIRLMSYNKVANTKRILAFANFTLSGTNSAGYGLEVIPNPVALNQQVIMNTTVPAGVTNASLTILNGDGSATVWNPNWYLVPGSQTLTYKFQKAGTYIIGVFRGDNGMFGAGYNQTLQIQVVITVQAAAVTPTAVTPTGGTAATSAQTTALVDLLSSNLFWALIFTVGMMTMIAFATMKREK